MPAKSKKQQKFFGMVHARQKGEDVGGPEVEKVAKDISKKDAKDFASTKHKGLPEKVKDDEDDNNDKKDEVNMSEDKKNRCWKGYKPAKGKKPYSDGSCVKENSLWQQWKELRESKDHSCHCGCAACKGGNCGGCTCKDCSCEGCSC